MIKVSVLYPDNENSSFDIDYYVNTHVPMVRELLGSAVKGFAIEQGPSGREPGSRPTYIAMGHIYFNSIDEFQSSFGPIAEDMRADTPNYTDIQPVLQISEVKLSKAPDME